MFSVVIVSFTSCSIGYYNMLIYPIYQKRMRLSSLIFSSFRASQKSIIPSPEEEGLRKYHPAFDSPLLLFCILTYGRTRQRIPCHAWRSSEWGSVRTSREV